MAKCRDDIYQIFIKLCIVIHVCFIFNIFLSLIKAEEKSNVVQCDLKKKKQKTIGLNFQPHTYFLVSTKFTILTFPMNEQLTKQDRTKQKTHTHTIEIFNDKVS